MARTSLKRPVRIFAPSRTAMSQGVSKVVAGGRAPCWKIAFNNIEKWQNPIMGWTSTGDPLENVARTSLAFETKEDAIDYCHKYGYTYEVAEAPATFLGRPTRFISYGDNFSVKRKGFPEGGLRSLVGEAPAKGKAKA